MKGFTDHMLHKIDNTHVCMLGRFGVLFQYLPKSFFPQFLDLKLLYIYIKHLEGLIAVTRCFQNNFLAKYDILG